MTFHPNTLPNLKGKVFIVTGGNSGMSVSPLLYSESLSLPDHRGYHTVAHLAEHGAHVYLCARSPDKGNSAIASIKKMHPSANIDLLQMDLMDLASVVAAAKRFLALETALHGLVNNAGIMATPFEMTKDGHEAQWQTNHLSHWVFTTRLLPLMRQTAKTLPAGSVRIVNVSSSGHLGAPKGGINFVDTSIKDGSVWARYGQSKLGQILHVRTLHETYGPGSPAARNGEGEIWVSSIHPGIVETNLGTAVSQSGFAALASVFRGLGIVMSGDKGSWSSLYCVASPDMKAEESGGYFEIHKRFGEPRWQSGDAKDEKLAKRLEEWTTKAMRKDGWIE